MSLLCNCPLDRREVWSRGQIHNPSCANARCGTCGGTKEERRPVSSVDGFSGLVVPIACFDPFHGKDE